ncbi:hypothetical protein HG536_0G01810 [Torulaspora globosa]|uniref:Uncharacterized protein n=1 Tax=Torulaspora globosa TaxID=48254 RepID=A0A7G3ZLD6_9SACH|nr:uncharacterized protein HG536_0G01810 [Torulaspora globosa]QLL34322.1 hypothetical protein HG536_0G01810 [Torulaspora globosa]
MLSFGYVRRKLLRHRIYLIAGLLAYFILSFCFFGRQGLISSRLYAADTPGSKLFRFLYDAVQRCEPIKRPGVGTLRDSKRCQGGDLPFNPIDLSSKGSYENLDSCLHLTDGQLKNLKSKHSEFLGRLRKFLANNKRISVDSFANETGIVTVGGGKFSVLSLIMIEMLREKGSQLPVEVIIPPSDEGDADFCAALADLNAKCVFFSDMIPEKLIEQIPIKGYQFKIIALLISSFKKVLFLDADNLPLVNPDQIFEQPVFLQTGLVIWPDIWGRVTSPAFYQSAGVEVDLNTRVRYMGDDISPASRFHDPKWTSSDILSLVPLHDLGGTIPDPTSESGQLLVDKTKHLSTLLLAAYYNFHSEWYFRLLSQGTSGEGDKETFIAAAHVLKEPYYQVKTRLAIDGFFDEDNSFHGICLYQFNPQQDYEQHAYAKRWMAEHLQEYATYDPSYDVEKDFYDKWMKPSNGESIDAMFGHASFHKFEPLALARERIYVDRSGRHFRGFKRYDITKGFDIELFNYKLLHRKLCSARPLKFKFYESTMHTKEWSDMCRYLAEHIRYLHNTHHLALSAQNIP